MSQVSPGPLVGVERRGPAVWLTMSRPNAANALSRGLVDELSSAVGRLSDDASVRAVVITGGGRTFCAGADLNERLRMTPEETRAFLDELGGLLSCPVR